MHLVRAGLLLLGREEPDPEPGVVARQERDAVVGVVGHLPAQDAGPEAREDDGVVRVEAERDEVGSHPLRRYEGRWLRAQRDRIGGQPAGPVRLDAQRVEGGREHRVVPDEHHQLDGFPLVELGPQLGPEAVGHVAAGMQGVGGPEQQPVPGSPRRIGGAEDDPVDLVLSEAGAAA